MFSGNWQLRFARRNTLSGKRPNPGSGSTGISGPRLLKWLNSLYRPALPEGIRGRLVPPLSRQLNGASPSGKAVDFDSTMRRFESSRPSQPLAVRSGHMGHPSLGKGTLFGEFLVFRLRKACRPRAFENSQSPARSSNVCGENSRKSSAEPNILPFPGDLLWRPGNKPPAWQPSSRAICSGWNWLRGMAK